jgi:phosphoadenosine phosphosulfate reductase
MMAPPHIETDEIAHYQDSFEGASPQEILAWAVEYYQESLVLVTSFQPTGIVTLHMLHEIGANTQVITLDTGVLFPETYTLMDQLEQAFNLRLKRIRPELSIAQQAAQYGDNLWSRDPDECCHIRKTLPLKRALEGYRAWITGLRRDQSRTRSQTPVISWDQRYGLVKLCPFADWTEEMIWTYIHAHALPYNELHDRGYPSIGCTHCTQAVAAGQDARSGRWANHAKTECGIHVHPATSSSQ